MFNIDPKDLSLQDAAGMQLVKLIKRAGETAEAASDNVFIITATPESEFAGTVDKTMEEIKDAYTNNKRIFLILPISLDGTASSVLCGNVIFNEYTNYYSLLVYGVFGKNILTLDINQDYYYTINQYSVYGGMEGQPIARLYEGIHFDADDGYEADDTLAINYGSYFYDEDDTLFLQVSIYKADNSLLTICGVLRDAYINSQRYRVTNITFSDTINNERKIVNATIGFTEGANGVEVYFDYVVA